MFEQLSSTQIRYGVTALVKDALRTSFDLFTIIVPMSILVRILDGLGLIEYLGIVLKPFMELMGLPGSMGLVTPA